MAHRFDFSEGSWEFDTAYARDSHREPPTPARTLTADDFAERCVLAAGITTASIDDLDCEDGIDEAKWDAAMEQGCEVQS